MHRGLSEQDAEDVLLSRDVPGSWLLREVLADEAWGDTVEAEVAVDRGGIPTTCVVSLLACSPVRIYHQKTLPS